MDLSGNFRDVAGIPGKLAGCKVRVTLHVEVHETMGLLSFKQE
jgi:hypothetical protein